jgi:AcrR family transcriptional regulator
MSLGETLMAKSAFSAADPDELSHNLLGQRLGRKGRDTRERILAATERLLAGPPDTPITLSAVAREASLGMTSLYLYFNDLTELLIAQLSATMALAEEAYTGHLRGHWPDDTLGQHCLRFVEAYHAFWVRHSRILHLRNSYADGSDVRMRRHRIEMAMPLIQLFVQQMEGDPSIMESVSFALATVLLMGIERVVTATTDVGFTVTFSILQIEDPEPQVRRLLEAEARLLELGVRDRRQTARFHS